MHTRWIFALALLIVPVRDAVAQGPVVARPETRSRWNGIGADIAAATIGSVAGIAAVSIATSCGVDDLGCGIQRAAGQGLGGVVGATIAVSLFARSRERPHSLAGATLGGLLGTAVGLGVHWLVNQNSDRNIGDAVTLPIFALSQGVLSAVVSRQLAR